MQQSRPTLNLYKDPDVTYEGPTLTLVFHHIYLFLPRHADVKPVQAKNLSFAACLSFSFSLCSRAAERLMLQ